VDKYDDIKRQKEGVKYDTSYSSSTLAQRPAELGTIEKDASGHCGKFASEPFRGKRIHDLLLQREFETVLDVGAGKLEATSAFVHAGKTVDVCDFEDSYYLQKSDFDMSKIRNKIIGDINELEIPEKYDAIWAAHVLEHQLNPNAFLKKLNSLLKEGGNLAVIVPPRKPFIVGGHVSLWNGGLLLYHLILAGFDCSEAQLLQYDYNIGVVVQKKSFEMPKLNFDLGDINLLKRYFPVDVCEGFNGDILEVL